MCNSQPLNRLIGVEVRRHARTMAGGNFDIRLDKGKRKGERKEGRGVVLLSLYTSFTTAYAKCKTQCR